MYDEEDYLMLSGIQHFIFCRRQWALIHIEQQWTENYQTTAGELFHSKAHDENSLELRNGILTVRGLRVSSRELGVIGTCDIVEFHSCENGIHLQGYDGGWSVVPIEYKRGSPKEGDEDRSQLIAQVICLEEMFATHIDAGYLFYGETRRRIKVEVTDQLRNTVKLSLEEMHQLFQRGYTPKVKTSKKCNSCSIREQCLPKIQKNSNVSLYLDQILGDEI